MDNTKENHLTIVKTSIWTKLKSFLKNLFYSKKEEQSIESSLKTVAVSSSKPNFKTEIKAEDKDAEIKKIQYEVENGITKLEILSRKDLKNLINLYKKQIDNLKTTLINEKRRLQKI